MANSLPILKVSACLIEDEDLKRPPKTKPLKRVSIRINEENGLIVKPIAVTLCYSDAKILTFGKKNPRVSKGIDKNGWIIPGHEVVFEVIESIGVPEFIQGDILHLQPSSVYNHKKYLFGFTEPGGLCTKNFIGKKFLNSDIGGNVLKLNDIKFDNSLSLIEPWSCIEADFSINIPYKKNRRIVFIDDKIYSGCFKTNSVNPTINKYSVTKSIGDNNANEIFDIRIKEKLGNKNDQLIISDLVPKGISIFIKPSSKKPNIEVDLHDIHYKRILFSTQKNYDTWWKKGQWDITDHYRGHVILFGGAGPMGQMFLKRLLLEKNKPNKITIIDKLKKRLDRVLELSNTWCVKDSIHIETLLIPKKISNGDEIPYLLKRISGLPNAIIFFCPEKSAIEKGLRVVKDNGLVNVFAGMPPGSRIKISSKDLTKNVVLFGRSGSTINDSKVTLNRIKNSEINLNDFISNTTNFDNVWSSLIEVKNREVEGKVLVLPDNRGLNED